MKEFFKNIYRIIFPLRKYADFNLTPFVIRSAYYHMVGKRIYSHHNVHLKGLKNIKTNGNLFIAIGYTGFLNSSDRTFLNIRGNLEINGDCHIGKGCRVAITEKGRVVLNRCVFTGLSNMIINNFCTIGNGSLISWSTEILDDDWHVVNYIGKKEKKMEVVIGNHVWIGNNVLVRKRNIHFRWVCCCFRLFS